MRLFIPLNTLVIKVIGSCSHNARVTPLSDMKRGISFKWRMRIIACIRGVTFYELLDPIQKNSSCKKNTGIYHNNVTCKNCPHNNKKNVQGQDMSPEEAYYSLDFSPNILSFLYDLDHCLYPSSPRSSGQQNIILSNKNIDSAKKNTN